MTHWKLLGILTEHFRLRFARRLFALWELLIETCDARHARGPLVSDSPLRKQLLAFLPDFGIGHRISSRDPESFQERFVCEFTQESVTGILDEEIEYGQRAQLSVKVSIFPALD